MNSEYSFFLFEAFGLKVLNEVEFFFLNDVLIDHVSKLDTVL
jgi:hypothetical protein